MKQEISGATPGTPSLKGGGEVNKDPGAKGETAKHGTPGLSFRLD